MQFVDIHTHQSKSELAIRNVFAQDFMINDSSQLTSVGLHPWHIDVLDTEQALLNVAKASTQKNVKAIGECGLDRNIKTDFTIQEALLKKQINLAKESRKPLIIHCVRAYPDLIRIKKESSSTIPWIIHGYSGNIETTVQLLQHDFYFSIGTAIERNQKLQEAIKQIPSEKMFLETDESNYSIREIYSFAVKHLNIETETLMSIIYNNYKRIFE